MNACKFEIIENSPLTKDVYLMRLSGDTGDITAPGQFVNIKIDGLYLRRPISVCDVNGDELVINTGKTYIGLIPLDSWDSVRLE